MLYALNGKVDSETNTKKIGKNFESFIKDIRSIHFSIQFLLHLSFKKLNLLFKIAKYKKILSFFRDFDRLTQGTVIISN